MNKWKKRYEELESKIRDIEDHIPNGTKNDPWWNGARTVLFTLDEYLAHNKVEDMGITWRKKKKDI